MSIAEPMREIEWINAVRRRAVLVPRRPPVGVRCPICHSVLQVLTSHGRLSFPTIVLDGLSSTLYACLKDRLLWIHEVGGIANVDSWLGPVPAEANDLVGSSEGSSETHPGQG